ncbi:CUB domain-containing protein 2-like [Paramacrobiotus metropolitanus]|uniref:CUB domain-containing protein 2-like n=1 Tax=Paramacrobiotus metropolitanus TaxID=2943436 RepID=UPI00244623FB|nr:CUB domain-containing protein 2-like [Paramacrobiotus metropolitanus]
MIRKWLLLICTAAVIVANSLLDFVTAASGDVLLCDTQQNIESSPRSHWGYIASPNHAKSYPAEHMQCMFKFLPKADEQIQLIFTYFNLRESDKFPAALNCDLSDSVKIFVGTSSPNASEPGNLIGEYCGRSKIPEVIMAVGPRPLTVLFTTRAKDSPMRSLYMFKAKYEFRKDYGLGKMAAQHNRTAGCHFVYDGRKVPATGTLQSPNFGGYYPLSTNCIYTFRLFNNQSLQLRFHTFKVVGQQDCRGEDDDTLQIKVGEDRYDWTEFLAPAENDPAKRQPTSNLYCGYKFPPQFIFANNVVHVIFKSGPWRTNLGFLGTNTFLGHPGIWLSVSTVEPPTVNTTERRTLSTFES